MTLHTPGRGKGRALHIDRMASFKDLASTGAVSFEQYTPAGSYLLITCRHDERHLAPVETVAYLTGAFDLYNGVRDVIDEIAGPEALDKLDDIFLEPLARASGRFLDEDAA